MKVYRLSQPQVVQAISELTFTRLVVDFAKGEVAFEARYADANGQPVGAMQERVELARFDQFVRTANTVPGTTLLEKLLRGQVVNFLFPQIPADGTVQDR